MKNWFNKGHKTSATSEPRDPNEFLRALAVDGKLEVHLDCDMFTEPGQAGIFLVDIARHYARAFTQAGRCDSEGEALESIRKYFELEWDRYTDEIEGGLVN